MCRQIGTPLWFTQTIPLKYDFTASLLNRPRLDDEKLAELKETLSKILGDDSNSASESERETKSKVLTIRKGKYT